MACAVCRLRPIAVSVKQFMRETKNLAQKKSLNYRHKAQNHKPKVRFGSNKFPRASSNGYQTKHRNKTKTKNKEKKENKRIQREMGAKAAAFV